MKQATHYLFRFLIPFGIVIIVWSGARRVSNISPALFPTPWEVGSAFIEYTRSGDLFGDLCLSLRRAVFGLVCGGALGLFIGTLTGRIRVVNWLLGPVFNGLRAIPPVAIVPLVIVWAGLGEPAKVFITSWAAFLPIWLNTHVGVSSVDKVIIWTARSLGARNEQLLFSVTFPAALSQILVGLRLAISSTLLCVIVAEMTGASAGLGYRLQISYVVFRVDRMLVCLALLSVIGVVADHMFNIIAARLFPWIKLSYEVQ